MDKDQLIKRIEEMKAVIDSRRPLSHQEIKELDDYYRIGNTYSSNALEGSTLTISETKVLIEDGITVAGKPLRDCYEATGHAKAYDFMLKMARSENLQITADIILTLHRLFYSGIDAEAAGKYRAHQVFITGTEYIPPSADEIEELMEEFVGSLQGKVAEMHPVEFAAYAHRKLVDIHPFADGNGRTARLLMNLILVNKGYCVISIPPVLRLEYIDALRMAQREKVPSDRAFVELICECEIEAQRDYCRMFHIKI